MRSRHHWCLLEVDKRDLQPTAKLLTQQKHLLSCMIFGLVTMCMSKHTYIQAGPGPYGQPLPLELSKFYFFFFDKLNIEHAKFCFKVTNLDFIEA